jgi:PEGA domain
MRRNPFAFPALWMALIASALDPRLAAAQPADAGLPHNTPLIEALSGAAREAYEAAIVLLNNKDCAHAIAKYRQAYELSRDPRLLFDIAVCDRDLRAYAQMQGLLLRYEREADAALSPEEKADVAAALAAIHDLVGTVHLTVSEPDAEVTVDAEAVGTTPLAAPLVVDLGKHTLSVKKDGFEPVERTIEIAGGNDTSMAIALVRRPHPAWLRVEVDPGATVMIDRKELARGSFDGQLMPGVHEIQVTESGKKTYESRVSLSDGETRTLQVTLEAEGHGALWPWIAGAVVVLVGAGVGGYFLLRPQETPGAGPQGQLFTVKLGGN